MSAHTPGPWRAIASGQTGRAAAAYYIQGSVRDARCNKVAHVKNSPRLPVKANARLIAAAPDLLAALREVSAELESHLNDPSASLERGFAVATRARAALAKAVAP